MHQNLYKTLKEKKKKQETIVGNLEQFKHSLKN